MPKNQRGDVKRTLRAGVEATGYVAYFFRKDEQDPVVDTLRTLREDMGSPNNNKISEGSGVAAGTLANWWKGKTRRPQFATINAVAGMFGYEMVLRPKTGVITKKLVHAHAPEIIKKDGKR